MQKGIVMFLFSAKNSRNHRGFSLLEVLVTVVVLSVGLLGIAALQLKSLRFTYDSNLFYLASQQANDMADRMRANRQGVIAGAYNNLSTVGVTNPGCVSTGCSTAQMAQVDAFEWGTSLKSLLPSGTGTVKGSGINSPYTIAVQWQQISNDGNNVTMIYSLSVRP